jgi:hypothetical protein
MDLTISEFFSGSGMSFLMTYTITIAIVSSMVGLALAKEFKQKRTLFFAYLVAGFLSLGELLSRPKPVGVLTWLLPKIEKAHVIGALIKPKKAIHVLYFWPDMEEPRFVIYPWNDKFAKKLQGMMDAQRRGDILGIEVRNPFEFEKSLEDRELEVHPLPWPKMPNKERENQEIIDLDTTG